MTEPEVTTVKLSSGNTATFQPGEAERDAAEIARQKQRHQARIEMYGAILAGIGGLLAAAALGFGVAWWAGALVLAAMLVIAGVFLGWTPDQPTGDPKHRR